MRTRADRSAYPSTLDVELVIGLGFDGLAGPAPAAQPAAVIASSAARRKRPRLQNQRTASPSRGRPVTLCGEPKSDTHHLSVSVYGGRVRTNIEIDDDLLDAARRVAGTDTKRATVEFALRELARRHERAKVLELRGSVDWRGDLDESRRGRAG